ncbi:MAG: 8-amino-7-oxononanoate synthase [Saprospiraceae bacterium]|jgi:8-amino-7-oxononanoate synthase
MTTVASSSIEQRIGAELTARQQSDQLRSLELVDGIDFCSNDYLGLAQQPLSLSLDEHLTLGSTGSRLVSGNSEKVLSFEQSIARFHGFEQGLLFSAGYAANSGLLACLGKKGDLMLLDSLAHASLIDGARLSFAKRIRFKHNDLCDLEAQLIIFNANKTAQSQQAFVVVEAVYSMDGDIAPLEKLASLCKRLNAALVVDEAHSIGLYGRQGEGLIAELGLQQDVFAAVYTYGKAMGHHGAVIAGSTALRDYLVNYCRPFIYTTAPSEHHVAMLTLAYVNMQAADDQRSRLAENLTYFAQKVKSLALDNAHWLASDTPIQALVLRNAKRTKAVALSLREAGLAVKAIVSPTVAEGSERLRICIHSHNSHANMDLLANELAKQVGIV